MPEPYRVNNVGNIGLIDPNDLQPNQLPKEAWSRAQNIRMINGQARVTDGFKGEIATLDPTIHALDYYSGPDSQHLLVFGDQFIYSVDGSGGAVVVKDMAGDAGVYPAQIWVTDKFNTIPIATNNLGSPQCQYNNGLPISATTPFVPFPDWDTGGTYANAQCLVVAAYKNFIVALNITEANPFPNLVAWSDVADAGLMPVSWDYNDPTTLAGRRVVGAEDGILLAARQQRNDLIIYAERGTYRMTFVPGSDLIMDVNKIFDNFGAFGPRSVGSYGARHFVVTKDDVVVHDGQQWDSVGEERVRNRVFASLTEDDTNRLYVTPYLRFSEMFVGVPNDQDLFLNALTWRWADKQQPWSVRDLPSSRHVAEVPYIEVLATPIVDTWEGGPDEPWDTGRDIIWDFGVALGDFALEATSIDGSIYSLDSSAPINPGFLERVDINLGMEQTLETLTDVFVRSTGSEPMTVTVGASMAVNGAVKWGKPATFMPGSEYHITRMATGRRHAIRFEGLNFSLQGYDMVWEFAGEE